MRKFESRLSDRSSWVEKAVAFIFCLAFLMFVSIAVFWISVLLHPEWIGSTLGTIVHAFMDALGG